MSQASYEHSEEVLENVIDDLSLIVWILESTKYIVKALLLRS